MKTRSSEATSASTGAEPARRVIRDLVDHQAATRPDATYLIAPETGRAMSFGALRSASLRLAAFLAGRGIGPGQRVGLMMHNGYQTCRLFVGAMYGGYCVTPLNLVAQASQLEYVLEHSDLALVFASPDQTARLGEAFARIGRQVPVVSTTWVRVAATCVVAPAVTVTVSSCRSYS